MLNLNDKERMLLQDEKAGEELCIEKYKKYSEEAVTKMINGILDKIYHEEEK